MDRLASASWLSAIEEIVILLRLMPIVDARVVRRISSFKTLLLCHCDADRPEKCCLAEKALAFVCVESDSAVVLEAATVSDLVYKK